MKKQFNVRLEEETIALVEELAEELGVSQADIIRMAVRLLAKRENVRTKFGK